MECEEKDWAIFINSSKKIICYIVYSLVSISGIRCSVVTSVGGTVGWIGIVTEAKNG